MASLKTIKLEFNRYKLKWSSTTNRGHKWTMTDTDDWKATEFDKKDSSGPSVIDVDPVSASSYYHNITLTYRSFGSYSNSGSYTATIPASYFGNNNYIALDSSSHYRMNTSGFNTPSDWANFDTGASMNVSSMRNSSWYPFKSGNVRITSINSPVVGVLEDGRNVYDISNGFSFSAAYNIECRATSSSSGSRAYTTEYALKYQGVEV